MIDMTGIVKTRIIALSVVLLALTNLNWNLLAAATLNIRRCFTGTRPCVLTGKAI